jgi:hypothetical protein
VLKFAADAAFAILLQREPDAAERREHCRGVRQLEPVDE